MEEGQPLKIIWSMMIDLTPTPKYEKQTISGRRYTPTKVRRYMDEIALLVKSRSKGMKALDRPLYLGVTYFIPRPKTVSRPFPTGKPDTDNYTKALKDGMTKAGIWRDDSLVITELCQKRYTSRPIGYIDVCIGIY